jgi:phosphonate degradation associated HDIG domain protein
MKQTVIDSLKLLFATKGNEQYFGEPVTVAEHMLQAAFLATRASAPTNIVLGALFHDVGHLLHGHNENCADDGVDAIHERIGADFLASFLNVEVTAPIRLHVLAKRYLCAREPGYFEQLSQASKVSLALQGGPFSRAECENFLMHDFASDAIALRRFDDAAKVVGLEVPSFDSYLPLFESYKPSML